MKRTGRLGWRAFRQCGWALFVFAPIFGLGSLYDYYAAQQEISNPFVGTLILFAMFGLTFYAFGLHLPLRRDRRSDSDPENQSHGD